MAPEAYLLQPYSADLAGAWDAVVQAAPGGTLLHSRRFLDYHGTRFHDVSLVGRRPGEPALSAVLPLAVDRADPTRLLSHPGSSFGGVVCTARDPAHAGAFLRDAAAHLRAQGFLSLNYRCTPGLLLRQPDDGLHPMLFRLGQVSELHLWSVLRLNPAPDEARRYWQSEIRRGQRKGLQATPVNSAADWQTFHDTLSGRLKQKYATAPVHSVAELIDLQARLGPQSRATLVRAASGEVLAALWFIDYGTGTLHNQYNGATDAGLALGASSFGIALALEAAATEGFAQFSFGRSTLEDGWSQNRGLQRFKARFGAGLVSQYQVDLPLERLAD